MIEFEWQAGCDGSPELSAAKLWVDRNESIELGAWKQIDNLRELPFIFHHVAIMPDVHCGYGMPIGGVLATRDVVIPNAVGVDIGCGMLAMRTNISGIKPETLKNIMGIVRSEIPVGFNHRAVKADLEALGLNHQPDSPVIDSEWTSAAISMGTLGGGNHFIEFQMGSDEVIWVMIHSESRNLGKKVADYHNKIARDLNEKYWSQVPLSADLAFLPTDSQEGQNYIRDMDFCVQYAQLNRRDMMRRIETILKDKINSNLLFGGANPPGSLVNDWLRIESIHNYMAIEYHFGRNVCVHRKGAVRAREGDICIIPGSQGSASYICRGLGNIHSFQSCSHGAGRKMGRKEAQGTLSLESESLALDNLGVIHSLRTQQDLDEAPGAYKDIDWVMAQQTDLVEIQTTLRPLAVIKG